MIVAIPNLHISGKKYLKPLLEMLFELPWRQIVPFEGWEDGKKDFSRNQAKNTFSGILRICPHSFLWGLPGEVRKSVP